MCWGSCLVSWVIVLLFATEVTLQDPHHDSYLKQRDTQVNLVQRDGINCTYSSECVFSFTYKGVTYSECTTVDNLGEYWCSHTSEYNGLWSNCNCPGIYEVSVAPSCTFPNECVFPFQFDYDIYSHCTTAGNYGQYWCSHDKYYSGEWSECQCSTTVPDIPENPCDAPEECVFPFEYNGITYLTCTTVGNAGEYWCAHDTNYNGDWSDCNCPSTLYEVTVTLEENPCIVPSDCVFPFTYNGVTYTTCTTADNWGDYWCAHNAVYDGSFSNCVCFDDDTQTLPPDYPCSVPEECVFPFTYKGVTYMSCTTANWDGYWCAHNTVYREEWSECDCPQ